MKYFAYSFIAFLLVFALPAQAQNKTELLTNYEEVGFFQLEAEISHYLLKAAKEGKLKAYRGTTPLKPKELTAIQRYFDQNVADTITIRPSEWHLEVATKAGEIQTLGLVLPKTYFYDNQVRRINFKYKDCKKYLQKMYKKSLKYKKIDRLEAVYYDFKDRTNHISMVEALEKHLYKSVESDADGAAIVVNAFEKRQAKINALLVDATPFFMQNSPTEKHTVLYRNVDFRIFEYPFEYNDFDKLPLKVQIEAIKNISSETNYPYKNGLGFGNQESFIDSAQHYKNHSFWREEGNNFMVRLREGIEAGKVQVYAPIFDAHEQTKPKKLNKRDFAQKMMFFNDNVQDTLRLNMEELKLSWKEYYYTDLQGNPLRSEIEWLTLINPEGNSPTSILGDEALVSLPFKDVKAYFQALYQKSAGKVGGIDRMNMAEALEKHQNHTSTVWKYFNPFDMDIPNIVQCLVPDKNPQNKFNYQRKLRQNLKDKMNNLNELPARTPMPENLRKKN